MIDEAKIRQAVSLFLEGIWEDPAREGLLETPGRIARMCLELYAGMDEDPRGLFSKTFQSPSGDLVVERDIVFHSICEHHFMPFFGKAHVAYVPDGLVVGLSKLARSVELFARRPQIQEQMGVQIADAVMDCLKPHGVMVVLEAQHLCMTMRGIKKPGSQTLSVVTRGCFAGDLQLQDVVWKAVKG